MSTKNELSEREVNEIRALLDRDAIRRCLDLYFHALDSRQYDLLNQVFVAEIDLADDKPATPLPAFKEILGNVSRFRTSHHGVRNVLITLDGDRAHSSAYCLDTLLVDVDLSDAPAGSAGGWPPSHAAMPGPYLRRHGLRYLDDLERRPEGWRIVKRRGPFILWRHHTFGVEVNPQADHLREWDWA